MKSNKEIIFNVESEDLGEWKTLCKRCHSPVSRVIYIPRGSLNAICKDCFIRSGSKN